KLSALANFSTAPSASDLRPESCTDSRARARNSSVEIGRRAAPVMRNASGIRPTWERWNIPGRSLRLARSPVAPKRTITWLVLTRSEARSSTALSVVTLTVRRLQAAIARLMLGRMAPVTKGGTEYDPAALERTEARFYRDLFDAAPAEGAAAHGVRRDSFGPVQATVVAALPEVRALNLVLGG